MLDNLLLGTSLAALMTAGALGWLLNKRTKSLRAQLQAEADARKTAEGELAKYSHIIDAEAEVQRLVTSARDKANAGLEEAKNDAARLLSDARRQVDELLQSAQKRVQEAFAQRSAAEATLSAARTKASEDAKSIVAAAEARAAEILAALARAEVLRREVEALEAKIKGYGNTHMIPGRSLLDDLATEYDHTQAGRDLKDLRARVRAISKAGEAATCDYVEQNRRITAINFVTDAFNGKVEDVISRAKTDNYGVLKREIEDSFVLVNMNGRAFRDARIKPEYRDLRLEELRLATVMKELRDKDREEQRVIKERIREEERARREYEAAIKQAARDEDVIRKALEKARKEAEAASESQRTAFEEHLRELQAKLHEAEERNQRALSMAQQTKSGHIYVISNIGSFGDDIFKIGMTRRLEPLDRIRELGDASVPFEFDVHAMIYSEDAPRLENELHKMFVETQVNKVNPRKEFFKLSLSDLRLQLERLGHTEVHWTMAAEARQYRETLAIEERLAQDPNARAAWIREHRRLEDLMTHEEEVASN
jgi:vacuolar-type H+-ATPase subunit H